MSHAIGNSRWHGDKAKQMLADIPYSHTQTPDNSAVITKQESRGSDQIRRVVFMVQLIVQDILLLLKL